MTVAEAIDVRGLLLESPSFGKQEIDQLRQAVEAEQFAEVRQTTNELQQLIDEGSQSQRDLTAHGIASYFMGRHEQADDSLSKVTENGIAAYYHGQTLMALGRCDDAAARLLEAGKDGHDPIQCTLEACGSVRLAGRLDEAEEILRSTGAEGAGRAEYSYQMGCILADRGDTYGAIEYFERAVDMDAHHTGALFRLAGQNNLLGNDQEAIRLYEQSLSKPPFHLGAVLNLGLLYEDIENYSAAEFCFRRVLDIYPRHERARLFLKDIEASTDMYYDEEAAQRDREAEQILNTTIADFELSARSRNCLEVAGINSLGDLTRISEQDLLAGKNFGETSLREIRKLLEDRGLSIGQDLYKPEHEAPEIDRSGMSPEERSLHEKSINELDLSVRSRKCVARLGITSIGELVMKSPDELLGTRNFGVTSLNEIRARLSEFDLTLRKD